MVVFRGVSQVHHAELRAGTCLMLSLSTDRSATTFYIGTLLLLATHQAMNAHRGHGVCCWTRFAASSIHLQPLQSDCLRSALML